jgi:polar amino acid transport system substrate-binding protein
MDLIRPVILIGTSGLSTTSSMGLAKGHCRMGFICMKRIKLVCLALLMLFAILPACQSSIKQALKERSMLRVAMDPTYPPFEFINNAGEIVGLDVDLAHQIGKHLGVDIHIVSIGYDALYDALIAGQADIIISALYPDPWRSHNFAFSPPYFNAGEVIVVSQNTPVEDTTDLVGRRVGVVFGTEGHMEALRWEKLLSPPPAILPQDSPNMVVTMLMDGDVDVAIVDNITAQVTLSHTPSLRVLTPHIADEIYVVAGRQEDKLLIIEISKIIKKMQDTGEMDRIISKWMHKEGLRAKN